MSSMPGPIQGPCNAWIDGADVAACHEVGSDTAVLDASAIEASQLLFEYSARQYANGCVQTVRPCSNACGCWGALAAAGVNPMWWWGPYPAGGNVWGWFPGAGSSEGVRPCGCGFLSRAKLSGYPVTAITEVKVGGDVIDEFDGDGNRNWRLDGWRWLTRMADPNIANPDAGPIARFWPACQNLALDDDQPGTWSITYEYGAAPPLPGINAAIQLAWELYQSCNGAACQLPTGVTKLIRQGVTIDRALFLSWGRSKTGAWATGLTQVDAFLNAYNPAGLRRRPAVWGPDTQKFAKKLGT